MAERPIFFDASGKRNRWTMRGFFTALALLLVTAAVFAATVVEAPIPGPLALAAEGARIALFGLAGKPLDAAAADQAGTMAARFTTLRPGTPASQRPGSAVPPARGALASV